MRLIVFIVFLFLLGCQTAPIQQEPELRALAERVWSKLLSKAKSETDVLSLTLIGFQISEIEFVFEEMPASRIATCSLGYKGFPVKKVPVIAYNPIYWQNDEDIQKEQTMLHELGHCSLGLPHDDGEIQENGVLIPVSVMRTYRMLSMYFIVYNNYYYEEILEKALKK